MFIYKLVNTRHIQRDVSVQTTDTDRDKEVCTDKMQTGRDMAARQQTHRLRHGSVKRYHAKVETWKSENRHSATDMAV